MNSGRTPQPLGTDLPHWARDLALAAGATMLSIAITLAVVLVATEYCIDVAPGGQPNLARAP